MSANRPKADEWARSLHRRFGGPIAIAVELSKGPIINVLQKYDFFVIFPVEPAGLASYRRTFTLSGAKDDPTDAEFALKLLLSHAEHFKPLQPQSVEMRTLMTLVEHRRQLMNDRVRITNRLRNTLKQYYPQPLEWFDRIDTPLFAPLPGAGPVFTPRLMVAFGEQRERFNNAAEVQKYGGLAPVTKRSGQSTWIHWRWQCPTFLRQTFVEWAAQTINKSYWAGLYYRQQRAKAARTRPLSEHSPSSGSASSIGAGKLAHRMTNPGILELYKNADRPCSKHQKLLD